MTSLHQNNYDYGIEKISCRNSAQASVSSWSGHFPIENLKQQKAFLHLQQKHSRQLLSAQVSSSSASPAIVIMSQRSAANRNHEDSEDGGGSEEVEKQSKSVKNHQQLKRETNSDSTNLISNNRERGVFSRQTGSSLIDSIIDDVDIEELQNENEPTTSILNYCKRKFLRPYLTLLSIIGLAPATTDATVWNSCCSYFRAAIVLVILLSSYCLQFLCAYRGDRGFAQPKKSISNDELLPGALHPEHTSPSPERAYDREVQNIGELLFGYIIPSCLHLFGFLSALVICKLVDQEQMQNLVERVFLLSLSPKRLCRQLWLHVGCAFILLCLLFAYAVPSVMMQSEVLQIRCLAEYLKDYQCIVKTMLLIAIFIEQFVEVAICCSYCVECFLLRFHLETLSYKLLMHSIEALDWMREVLEFRKLLDHLNQHIAVPVCFFIVMNLTYAFAGLVYLFRDFDFSYAPVRMIVLNVVNVVLWLVLGLIPFFMAASVSRVCQRAKANGHQIRVRPFVYTNTSSDDLNSMLLFASSLDMSAKLFRMPIQSNYLCFAIILVLIIVLTLGMCLNLSALGNL